MASVSDRKKREESGVFASVAAMTAEDDVTEELRRVMLVLSGHRAEVKSLCPLAPRSRLRNLLVRIHGARGML